MEFLRNTIGAVLERWNLVYYMFKLFGGQLYQCYSPDERRRFERE